jgi:hypothetical protein
MDAPLYIKNVGQKPDMGEPMTNQLFKKSLINFGLPGWRFIQR